MAIKTKKIEETVPVSLGGTGKVRLINISQSPIDIMLTNGDELRLEIPRRGSSAHISQPINKSVIPPGVEAMCYGKQPYLRKEEVVA